MCPSYRVTHEEEHSTRGRAHLLWEMTQGDVIRDGWRSEEVKDSLDLCLACKGCKSDCPVGVDVATYKAEFLSHYYEGRIRPPQRLRLRQHRPLGAPRVARPRPGESDHATSLPARHREARRRNPAPAHASQPSPRKLSNTGSTARSSERTHSCAASTRSRRAELLDSP